MSRRTIKWYMAAVVLCVILAVFGVTENVAYAKTYSWEAEVLDRLQEVFLDGGESVELADLYIPEEQQSELQEVLAATVESNFIYFYVRTSGDYVRSARLSYVGEYLDAEGNVNLVTLRRDYSKMSRVIDNIMLAVDEDMSDIEKVLYVHDWLVEQVDYAYEEYLAGAIQQAQYCARGPLLEHKAVCSGYAAAFSLLAKRMGVNVRQVSSGPMNHGWNMVELDGVWYHVDATWDDPVYSDYGGDYWNEGVVSHTYFLKSDDEFLKLEHHSWSETAPVASVSGAFTEEIFYGRWSPFGYKDGKWYWYIKNQIVQGDYEQTDLQAYHHNNYITNGVLVDDVYFFAAQDTIYSIPADRIEEGVLNRVYTANGYIDEFAVKDGIAIVIYEDDNTSEWVTERFSLAGELTLSGIEVICFQDYVEVGGTISTEEMEVIAETVNGYRFPVQAKECSFSSVDTSTPGIKQLKVEYMGETFQTSIRVGCILQEEYTLEATTYTYTGGAIQPVPTIFYEGKSLVRGQDYLLKYSNNYEVGTATIEVEGQGNYIGSFTIPFEITEQVISEAEVEVLFPEMDLSDDSTFWINIHENLIVRINGRILTGDEYDIGTVWYGYRGDNKILHKISLGFDNYRGEDDENLVCEVQVMPEGWRETYKFVERLYTIVLEREPDISGIDFWVNSLTSGSMTGVRVADGFVLSDEMLNKDISNEDFVKILYRAFFGREADADGLATWKNLLDAGCKKQYVFAGFANSGEFGALCAEAGIVQGRAAEYLADRQTGLSDADYKVWCFVERMYTEVLGRTADESGVLTWVGVLLDGSYTGVKVADGFLMSDEFLAKDMNAEEYVQTLYRAFFNRDADPEGLATWTGALENGWTKKRVFAGFANSNEFGVLCEQAGIVRGTAEEQ